MNIRRCPKCNGIVPEGNSTCNNCGHKMSFFGGSGLYVGSSKNANKLDVKENPFSDGKNNAGCVGWFVFIFMAVIFFQVYTIMKADFKENGISLEEIFNELEEDFDNFEDFDDENYCHTYCGSNDYEVGANTNCLCYNGDIYNYSGEKLYSGVNNKEMDSYGRCSFYCQENGTIITDVCYCENGKKYDSQGFNIADDNEYVVSNLMRAIDAGNKILVYSPGKKINDYLNPIEFEDVIKKYDFEYYYFDFDLLGYDINNRLRDEYQFTDFSMPYYYIYSGGQQVSLELGVGTKENLEMLIDNYLNMISQ